MKHLTLLLACSLSLCLSTSAQFTPQQYPFPYNPDSNQDGMVSMTDFLEILGLFGQEYPNSFHSDSTRAVLDLGDMGAHQCVVQAEAAGVNWRMLTLEDFYSFASLLAKGAPFGNNPWQVDNEGIWLWWSTRNHAIHGQLEWVSSTVSYLSSYDMWPNSDSTWFVYADLYPYSEGTLSPENLRRCFLVTEVRPTIEYSECQSPECISQKLNDGWLPLGASGYGGFGFLRESH